MSSEQRPATLPPRRALSDGVVLLREPVGADGAAIVSGATDPLVAQFTRVPSPYTADHARDFLETTVAGGWAESSEAVFAVCDATQPDLLLGLVGLHGIDLGGEPGGVAEIGYWMSPSGRGRGLMTRAVRLVSAWAVDELHLTRITWFAIVGNDASRRVAEANGYVVEGLLRRGEARRGERLDHWIGGLLAEDVVRPASS